VSTVAEKEVAAVARGRGSEVDDSIKGVGREGIDCKGGKIRKQFLGARSGFFQKQDGTRLQ